MRALFKSFDAPHSYFPTISLPFRLRRTNGAGLASQNGETTTAEMEMDDYISDPYASPRRPSTYWEALSERDVFALLTVFLIFSICLGAMQQLLGNLILDANSKVKESESGMSPPPPTHTHT